MAIPSFTRTPGQTPNGSEKDSNVAVLVRRIHHFDTAIKAKKKRKKN